MSATFFKSKSNREPKKPWLEASSLEQYANLESNISCSQNHELFTSREDRFK